MNKLIVILFVGLIISIGLNIYQYNLLLTSSGSNEPVRTNKPVKTSESDTNKTSKIDPDYDNGTELFPVFGVILGKTTVEELSELGIKSSDFDCYNIHGFDFWFSKIDNRATHVYLTRDGAIPQKWRRCGFDWRLSYNEWLNLLKEQEYTISIARLPEIVEYNGHDSFSAKFVATKMGRYPVAVTLDFQFSEGTSVDSVKTLYSINVSRI